MFTELQEDNLQAFLDANPKVLVQYGASWCGNCRIMKPKVKRLAEADENVAFLYIDAEKLPESRNFASVTNLPTFATFHNGTLVNQGATSKEETLKELYHEIANL